MSKYDELKRYLEVMTGPALVDSAEILELIAENERLREQCELNDLVHGTKGRQRLAILLKADADRASYWKQRAKSAEGHLYAGDMQQAARELHKRTSNSETPWNELTVAQRAQIEGAVLAVVAAVNAQRDARHPVDCDMESSK